MKNKIKSGLKIYVVVVLYLVLSCFAYSFYLSKSSGDYQLIIELVIGSILFLIIGLTYGNAVHKHGLFMGIGVALVHLAVLKLAFYLSYGKFEWNLLQSSIYLVCSGIGGILGISFKKIF